MQTVVDAKDRVIRIGSEVDDGGVHKGRVTSVSDIDPSEDFGEACGEVMVEFEDGVSESYPFFLSGGLPQCPDLVVTAERPVSIEDVQGVLAESGGAGNGKRQELAGAVCAICAGDGDFDELLGMTLFPSDDVDAWQQWYVHPACIREVLDDSTLIDVREELQEKW